MFVLTDMVPELYVYSGSASVRGGATAAATTVTMTLDPALTPDQVAGIYSRLKARVQPSPPARSLSVKHYRLAQHVGPHVALLILEEPSSSPRAGRRPRPDADGLRRTIAPIGDRTWRSLRHDTEIAERSRCRCQTRKRSALPASPGDCQLCPLHGSAGQGAALA
jgi:hypothetical protein